ncbi:hypothetical protein ARMGADRAFT_911305, partial [Armillaria gallica]
ANSVCILSSCTISLLENDKLGINPHFFNQKMTANNPEKKMPSTAVKATKCVVNKEESLI